MASRNYTTEVKTASGINLILGAWLVASPWVLIYGTMTGAWNCLVFGALIFVIGVIRVTSIPGPFSARVNLVFGLWTIASPWIFGYATGTAAMWNSIVVGILVAVTALWSASASVRRDRREQELITGH